MRNTYSRTTSSLSSSITHDKPEQDRIVAYRYGAFLEASGQITRRSLDGPQCGPIYILVKLFSQLSLPSALPTALKHVAKSPRPWSMSDASSLLGSHFYLSSYRSSTIFPTMTTHR